MTQAPTPGPLDSESVKMLVKGDLLRVLRNREDGPEPGSSVTFERADGNRIWINGDCDSWWFDRFAFIGRPDESGWMPWSGSPLNPVPDQMVNVMTKNGFHLVDHASERVHWNHAVSFRLSRLAPPAPVEASGSEREALAVRFHETYERLSPSFGYETRDETKVFDPTTPNGRLMIAVCGEILSTFRPQPSGETREAVARIVREEYERLVIAGDDKRDNADRASDRILALLSARPLALGGQQGEVVGYRQWCVSDKPHQGGWWQLIEKHDGDHAIATGGGKNLRPLYDTTPARAEAQDEQPDITPYTEDLKGLKAAMQAEAQDEGEAGEPVASGCGYFGYEFGGGYPDSTCIDGYLWDLDSCDEPGGGLRHGGDIPCPQCNAEAQDHHPSPTPAADADRVRIAVEALTKIAFGDGGIGTHRAAAQQALAALKSEGK